MRVYVAVVLCLMHVLLCVHMRLPRCICACEHVHIYLVIFKFFLVVHLSKALEAVYIGKSIYMRRVAAITHLLRIGPASACTHYPLLLFFCMNGHTSAEHAHIHLPWYTSIHAQKTAYATKIEILRQIFQVIPARLCCE